MTIAIHANSAIINDPDEGLTSESIVLSRTDLNNNIIVKLKSNNNITLVSLVTTNGKSIRNFSGNVLNNNRFLISLDGLKEEAYYIEAYSIKGLVSKKKID